MPQVRQTGGAEASLSLGWCDEVDEPSDGAPQTFDAPLGGLAQQGLEFGEGLLDRVEVGAVRREVEDTSAGGLDQGAHLRPLVAGEVVHHDDVSVLGLPNQDLADIGLEGVAVDRPVEHPGRDDAPGAEAGHEGRGLPMAVRHGHAQPLAAATAAMGARHVRARPGLVDEHQPVRVEVDLAIEPGLPPLQDVGALLLGGMGGLFLRVQPRRWKNRHSVP